MAERTVIGVCYCGTGEEYQDEICNGLIEYSSQFENVRLIFYSCFYNSVENKSFERGELSVFNLINFDKLDGMIILGQTIKDEKTIDKIISGCIANNVKTVCFDYETDRCSYVVNDSFKAVYELTSHLIEKHGCTKINFMAGKKQDMVSVIRTNAYMKALSDHGLPVNRERIGQGFWWTYTSEQECFRWLDSGPDFDGVVCANDMMAMSVIKALNSRGLRVPEDIKVAGLDNLREGSFHYPSITTAGFCYAQDVKDVLNIILGKKEEGGYKRELEVCYKESCGCGYGLTVKTDTNAFHREMYETIQSNNSYNEEMYDLASVMIERQYAEQSFEYLDKFVDKLFAKKLWVCVNKDLIAEDPDSFNGTEPVKDLPSHYSEYVKVIAAKDSEGRSRGEIFESAELCPDFDRQLDECKNLMVFPLHINDSILGYIVKEHGANFMMERLYTISMNLSAALLAVKQKNDMRLANQKLADMYVRDSMTNIYNRRGFFRELKKYMMTQNSNTMIVISVDLDDLKGINDRYGHNEGDNAIIVTAKSMINAAGEDLICARFGGDEFIAAGGYDDDLEFEEKFKDLLDDYNKTSRKPYCVNASVGYVVKKCSGFKDFDNLIRLADEKMYYNKMNSEGGKCRTRPRNT